MMTNFPHMMAILLNKKTENTMFDFEEINLILSSMADEGVVEPIDDPSIQTDFYDWADVVGVSDEIEPDVVFTVEG